MGIFGKKKEKSQFNIENINLSDIEGLDTEKDPSAGVEAIREIFDTKNIKMKSDISKSTGESHYFASRYIIAQLCKIDALKNYCDENIILRISNDRKGREEATKISMQVQGEEQKKGILRRLM